MSFFFWQKTTRTSLNPPKSVRRAHLGHFMHESYWLSFRLQDSRFFFITTLRVSLLFLVSFSFSLYK